MNVRRMVYGGLGKAAALGALWHFNTALMHQLRWLHYKKKKAVNHNPRGQIRWL